MTFQGFSLDPGLPAGCSRYFDNVTLKCPRCKTQWEAVEVYELGTRFLKDERDYLCPQCGERAEDY